MAAGTQLADALTREHHAIDAGIEAYLADDSDPAPLLTAMDALRRHIYLEERFLFPPLKPAMMMPIFVMLREHGELWRAMDDVDAAVAADTAGVPDQCRSLLAQLSSHNTKEEPIVYPRADADLSPEIHEQLTAFLAEGAFPKGWRCEQA
ncbi:hemerythrin domain-containing protein [Microbacterium sp. SYP-A9085]|uniref:hemerythrin domain-containing protein n=1 Tax=Microbacterium sp. SYP-A9085 TaxID=2664454 RepID=UPI00129AB636|nr:hemerythrin domain-containing protein [Microbacterium sp. SYP-A9085]MRH30180.1 hemerythrin domain-containing protein [Microbacterium sp. SYP-A9085]